MATSSVLERRLAAAERRTAPVRPGRDRFIDVLRAFAVLAIVGQHWILPVLSGDRAIPAAGGSPSGPGGWASVWLGPVLALIFFAGGATAANSLLTRRRLAGATDRPTQSWLAGCVVRLALPVLPLAVVLLPLHHLLIAAGVPERPVHSATELMGRLVWFLAAYALLVTLTPILVRLHDRCRGREVIVMAAGAVAVDIVRFVGSDRASWLGSANTVLVLGTIYQVGIAYDRGRLDNVRRSRMLALGAISVALGTLAVAIGPDVVPPTTVMFILAGAQLGLVLALRDTLTRWAAHRPVGAMLDWISARTVTIYLWHVPALAVLAGFAVTGFDAPQPFGAGWYSEAPLRLAVLAVGLATFVRAFGRYERSTQWRLVRRARRGGASLSPDSPVYRMGSPAPGRKT